MAHDAGLSITLASDAHVPELAGWGRKEVVAAAIAAGYEHYLRFELRKPIVAPMSEVLLGEANRFDAAGREQPVVSVERDDIATQSPGRPLRAVGAAGEGSRGD